MDIKELQTIEQSEMPKGPSALKSASVVSPLVAIDTIALVSGAFDIKGSSNANEVIAGEQEDMVSLGAATVILEFEPNLVVGIKMNLSLPPLIPVKDGAGSDTGNCADTIEISAQYKVVYRWNATEAPELESSSVVCFSRINSVYNVWPYWREFVHSTLGRMGCPSFMLPLLTAKRAVELVGLGLEETEAKTDEDL